MPVARENAGAIIAGVLVLNHKEVEQLLTMSECIGVMEEALLGLARGEVHQPLRWAVRAPGADGLLGLMPSYRGGQRAFYGLKAVCVFPGNPTRGLDSHLGAVLLFSGQTGELLATMNASAITAIRTAAVSAVATRLLAREDARVLAVLGAGTQARSHLQAIPLVRTIDQIRIYSRTRQKAEALAGKFGNATVASDAERAVKGADIIVTATSSREPILKHDWIRPGTHINAVGSSVASARELDSATLAAVSLFVDRRESTVNESGDYLAAVRDGAIAEGHIRAEIGEILAKEHPGRTSPVEITLFKSLGLGIEDLAAAQFLYDKALRDGVGTSVDFE